MKLRLVGGLLTAHELAVDAMEICRPGQCMEKPQSAGSMVLRLTATEAETDGFASTCRLHASVWLEENGESGLPCS
jgi:hypothetical protein